MLFVEGELEEWRGFQEVLILSRGFVSWIWIESGYCEAYNRIHITIRQEQKLEVDRVIFKST